MTSSQPVRPPLAGTQRTALVLLAVGVISAAVVGNLLDGFVGGLFQGAGIALILIGTFVLSPFLRRRFRRDTKGTDEPGQGGSWLPSQDGDR